MNIFDSEVLLGLFKNYYLLFLFGVFVLAFIITYYLIPKLLWVVQEKKLFKPVLERSAHCCKIPSFGGVAFFVTFVMLLSMVQGLRLEYVGNHLIAAITILFMVGLKDDLVMSSAKVKLLGQLTATAFIVFSPVLQITNLHGFLGIYEIPAGLGCLISGFLTIAIINAYNLIDGINGLAGVIGIIICSAYGLLFFANSNPFYVIICCLVVGILLAFLRFNFSRTNAKIFMGDSGSLVIGLIISFLTLHIIAMPPAFTMTYADFLPSHRILFVLAVLFIPFFDTARVMIKRVLNGRNPFRADRNHTHHILLDLGLNHSQASVSLGIVNVAVIMVFVTLNGKITTAWLSVCMASMYGLFFIFMEAASYYLAAKETKQNIVRKERKKRIRYMPKAQMEHAM